MMDVGLRVVRGRDWKWENQDGGEGHVGTVVEVGGTINSNAPEKTVVVQWDSGFRTYCRVGYQNEYDLLLWDRSPTGVTHPNVACDSCQQKGILGTRWKCSQCSHCDLCHSCYMSGKHDLSHAFYRFDNTTTASSVKVSKRCNTTQLEAKGIFPGAIVVRGPDWDWGSQDGGPGKHGKVLEIQGWDNESGRSMANVQWDTGSTHTYRLGHKGKVDLKYVTEASGGFYYREHLPHLGESYEKASAVPPVTSMFRVGDKVRIDLEVGVLRFMHEGHAGWNPKMAESIKKIGVVHSITDRGDVQVQFGGGRESADQRWTFPSGALMKVPQFDVVEYVKIIDDVESSNGPQETVANYENGSHRGVDRKALIEEGRQVVLYGNSEKNLKPKQRAIKRQKRKVVRRVLRRRVNVDSSTVETVIVDEPDSNVDVESDDITVDVRTDLELREVDGSEDLVASLGSWVARSRQYGHGKRGVTEEAHSLPVDWQSLGNKKMAGETQMLSSGPDMEACFLEGPASQENSTKLLQEQNPGEMVGVKLPVTKRKRDLGVGGGSSSYDSGFVPTKKWCQLPYVCEVCEKGFETTNKFKYHIRNHTGQKPYACAVCDKAFTKKTYVTRHSRIHTGVKPYRCQLCDKSFTRNSGLARHSRTHSGEKPYKCNICQKTFRCGFNLKDHARIHTGVYPYKCDVCLKGFGNLCHLERHKKNVHTGLKLYKCPLCDRDFAWKSGIATHLRIHTGEKPFKCKLCQKAFSDSGSLTHHKRIHTDDKPFKCGLCHKAFRNACDLERHKRIHTGERPYKCLMCQKSFTQQGALQAHSKTHTREKPFLCILCHKTFARHIELRLHAKRHLKDKPK